MLFEAPQGPSLKGWLSSRVLWLGHYRPRVTITLKDILYRALGDPETLGDLSHGLAVFQARGHDTLAQINGSGSHAISMTS